MQDYYPSKLLERSVKELNKLPGIGKRTALRLALHILKQRTEFAHSLGQAIIDLKNDIVHCSLCCNISDEAVCPICASPSREAGIICVVEGMRDVMAIENTHQYRGLYHVLGGLISPMDGVGPSALTIGSLMPRLANMQVKEIILALPATMEGDTTGFFLYKKISPMGVNITSIARGISIGDELESADELTLGRSIIERKKFALVLPGQ
jgi:recombination protein RecR